MRCESARDTNWYARGWTKKPFFTCTEWMQRETPSGRRNAQKYNQAKLTMGNSEIRRSHTCIICLLSMSNVCSIFFLFFQHYTLGDPRGSEPIDWRFARTTCERATTRHRSGSAAALKHDLRIPPWMCANRRWEKKNGQWQNKNNNHYNGIRWTKCVCHAWMWSVCVGFFDIHISYAW